MVNGDFDAAFEAARATDVPIRYCEGDTYDWFERAWEDCAIVALEQCCSNEVLLPPEFRETRLAAFPLTIRIATEGWLREAPPSLREDLLRFIFWFVRIERASRTGNPEFNPSRSLTVIF